MLEQEGNSGTFSKTFPPEPGSLANGRRAVERDLSGLVDPDDLDAVKLLVTEMLSNSVRHATLKPGDEISLSITTYDRRLRIEVEDIGSCFDSSLPRSPDDDGRGLMIIDSLSHSGSPAPPQLQGLVRSSSLLTTGLPQPAARPVDG